jgi:hypothetical protein
VRANEADVAKLAVPNNDPVSDAAVIDPVTRKLPAIPTSVPLSLICEFIIWSPLTPAFGNKFGVKNCSLPNVPVFSGPVITILLVLLVPA